MVKLYLLNVSSVFSIFLNTAIFLGSPSEALSERCGRHYWNKSNNFFGFRLRKIIDGIFFFDQIEVDGEIHGHCVKTYLIDITEGILD
jgi:hypothetical protein